jgi:hypothetical protein
VDRNHCHHGTYHTRKTPWHSPAVHGNSAAGPQGARTASASPTIDVDGTLDPATATIETVMVKRQYGL